MSQTILMHDGAIRSFEDVDQQGVTVDDDGEATFTWDEVPVVKVDAPSDLEGAFDTERFYKIEGATIARPIKQPYHVGDDVETYKKPADELRTAAWSFDNSPFTLGHPDTGMVKDVNDVHGFWKNPRYLEDEDRLNADLYIPETDEEARDFVAENQDVSVGFFNRVYHDYDGDTGDLTDEEGVDGYQVDIYGNHVAGVERGRCSSEQGCGLDSMHGRAVMATSPETQEAADATTSFLTKEDQTEQESESDVTRQTRQTNDQPSGIKSVDGQWFAVGPDEHSKDSTDHLANRIVRAAEAQDCESVPDTLMEQMDADCAPCTDNDNDNDTSTMDGDDFDIPDLSIDALAEQNDQVQELKEQKDEYEEAIEDLRDELDLDEDECPCDAVPDLKEDRDAKAETLTAVREALDVDEEADVASRVEDIADEWQEFRADQREDRLDTLEDLGAERDELEDATLDALDEEIERRKEVLDAVDDASPTGVEGTNDDGGDDEDTTISGTRRFGRGHAARPEAE